MDAAVETPSVLGGLGRWCFEMATPLVAGTYGAARSAVDVALTAAAAVLDGGERHAFGNCRPPGHHAARSVYGGFCYFNNAAIVAHHAAATSGARVSVLDVDYHHGNGTQQIFYDRADVQYVSLHGDPARAYPWLTGYADETGASAGRGTNLNVPLAARTDDDGYLAALGRALEAIDRFDPALVVVSLGVDTFHTDPISDFALTQDGFERCGRVVAALGRPTVVLLEGGYDLDAVGENVRRWLVGLL
jgi:acetoin utilization deacetylase AcuC-like enzyme